MKQPNLHTNTTLNACYVSFMNGLFGPERWVYGQEQLWFYQWDSIQSEWELVHQSYYEEM